MREKLRHLIRIASVGEGRRPREVLRLDVLRRQRELDTLSFHGGHIAVGLEEAPSTLIVGDIYEVSTLTREETERYADAVLQKPEVEVPVQLIHLLIGEIVVSRLTDIERGRAEVTWAEGEVALDALVGVVDRGECPSHPVGETRGE